MRRMHATDSFRSPPVRGGWSAALAATAVMVVNAAAWAQPTFSIDWHGPPKGAAPGCPPFANLIQEGDILLPPFGIPAFGPLPPPCVFIDAGFGPPAPGLGLPAAPGPVAPAGVPDFVEVDALSYGMEPRLDRLLPPNTFLWYFSVDEWAVGIAGTPAPPAVWTEGAAGAGEAAADVFTNVFPIGSDMICVGGIIGGNTDVIDGDGLPPFGGPGVGLTEPDFPAPGVPDMGSNLDGLDIDTTPLAVPYPGPVYYSLEGGIFDPLEGFPGSGSAAANGPFVGGDILVTPAPGAGPMMYAPAALLGLDMFGPGRDDVDALILWENGSGVYDPPTGPYSWLAAAGPTDMLLFSVRRGSAIIGFPDFFCGTPIEPGDILLPPPFPGAPPGIWIPAEALGLATARGGFGAFGDDMDALDVALDCNGNRQSDILDIATGFSADLNGNGIPDECEALCEPCDTNCDGTVNPFDINSFLDLINGIIPPCSPCAGDANGDGTVNPFDINAFLKCLTP